MSARKATWRDVSCIGLSSAITLLFLVFFAFSVSAGLSKESIYTGAVGFWLGAYLLFAFLASALCVALLVWMFFRNESRWKWHAVCLLCAWGATVVSYWAWHLLAQAQYVSAAA